MASSSKDSNSTEPRRSSSQSSQPKMTWNPVLKTDRPKFGYAAREAPAAKKEPSPRAPDKRPAVPRFRHPPAANQEEEFLERRPAVPRFRHPPERNDLKEDHPLVRGGERPRKPEVVRTARSNSAAEGGDRSELRPVKCRYCAQLLVVATQQQHERSCVERMLTDFIPDDDLPSQPRSARRSLSTEAGAAAAPSWAPPEQLRTRAQRHHLAVHAATREAMMAEEDDTNITITVDALEAEFKAFSKELSSFALPSAALALLGQLHGQPDSNAPLDQLIDLQRRHSVLGSILRLAEEHRSSKPPPFGPQPVKPHTPTGWPAPPVQTLSSSAETPRKNRPSNLPPLDARHRSLSRSSSRSSASVASVASRGPTERRGGRASRAQSVRSVRSNRGHSRASLREAEPPEPVELRASPGPAAVGFREMSMEEMKAEIEAERQQYIAQRLSIAS